MAQLEVPAKMMGIPLEELDAIIKQGNVVAYDAGACLFHESTPREWMGIILEGEVEIIHGLQGKTAHLATLKAGAVIAESILLDDCAHSASAYARGGAVKVIEIERKVLAGVKAAKPDIYYRIAARVAQRISDRLRAASEYLAAQRDASAPEITAYRVEHDSLGEREIPNSAYYGVQTLRAMENFAISGVPLSNFEHFVNALAYVKKAAAMANAELKVLDGKNRRCDCGGVR